MKAPDPVAENKWQIQQIKWQINYCWQLPDVYITFRITSHNDLLL